MSKCLKCFRPNKACICKHIEIVPTKTKFVILMHPKEAKKTKNGTGRMTHLSLPNSELIIDIDFTQNKRVNEIIKNYQSMILYPGENAFNCSKEKFFSEKDIVIFIIDATWPCAKKMMKLSLNLHNLPRISFDNNKKSEFLIKQQPMDLCLSTIEATQQILINLNNGYEILEQEKIDNFLSPFREMIRFQIACANDPTLKGYRKKPYTLPTSRKRSKKYNLIFKKAS